FQRAFFGGRLGLLTYGRHGPAAVGRGGFSGGVVSRGTGLRKSKAFSEGSFVPGERCGAPTGTSPDGYSRSAHFTNSEPAARKRSSANTSPCVSRIVPVCRSRFASVMLYVSSCCASDVTAFPQSLSACNTFR